MWLIIASYSTKIQSYVFPSLLLCFKYNARSGCVCTKFPWNSNLKNTFIAIKEITNANNAPSGLSIIPNLNSDETTNNPFPDFWAILLTIPFTQDDKYGVQIGVSIAAHHNGKIGVRTKDNGAWYEWNIIS